VGSAEPPKSNHASLFGRAPGIRRIGLSATEIGLLVFEIFSRLGHSESPVSGAGGQNRYREN
jgi:hypothetical protein